MSQENVEIVRRSVEAFGGDDEEAFLQTLDPDLVWYPIEDGPHSGARDRQRESANAGLTPGKDIPSLSRT
jgi:ketosteroid isomerase-like protein